MMIEQGKGDGTPFFKSCIATVPDRRGHGAVEGNSGADLGESDGAEESTFPHTGKSSLATMESKLGVSLQSIRY